MTLGNIMGFHEETDELNENLMLLEPIEHVLKEIGGTRQLSEKLGCDYQTVWNWGLRGKIPQRFLGPILKISERECLDIKANDLIKGRVISLRPSLIINKLQKRQASETGVVKKVIICALTSNDPVKSLFEFSQSGYNSIATTEPVVKYLVDDMFNCHYQELEKIRRSNLKAIEPNADMKKFVVGLAFKTIAKNELDFLKGKQEA